MFLVGIQGPEGLTKVQEEVRKQMASGDTSKTIMESVAQAVERHATSFSGLAEQPKLIDNYLLQHSQQLFLKL